MSEDLPDLTISLWANVSKNPRFKQVTFPIEGLALTLPKDVTMANAALRILINKNARCLSHPKFYQSKSGVSVLGGVVTIELLDLPEPGRTSRGWKIRTRNPFYIFLFSREWPLYSITMKR